VDALERRLGFRSSNCLASYYSARDATIGFQSNSIAELVPGTGVALVSLGAERVLRFPQIADRSIIHDFPLPSGSLLYLPTAVQAAWRHAVPVQEACGARISRTFRCLESRAESG